MALDRFADPRERAFRVGQRLHCSPAAFWAVLREDPLRAASAFAGFRFFPRVAAFFPGGLFRYVPGNGDRPAVLQWRDPQVFPAQLRREPHRDEEPVFLDPLEPLALRSRELQPSALHQVGLLDHGAFTSMNHRTDRAGRSEQHRCDHSCRHRQHESILPTPR